MIFERKDRMGSPMELKFLEACAIVGLIVEPQYKIGKIHVDFAIPERKLAIEIDGADFHKLGNEKDAKRNQICLDNGWNIVRFTGVVIYHSAEKVAEFVKRGKYDDATGYTISDITEEDYKDYLNELAHG